VQQMKTLGEFVGLADQFVQEQSQIASLTQTLALNASLVAARASEQRDPRQFAVVAREFDSIANQVGRLAQQTNEGLVTLEQRSTQIHSVVSIIDANIQNLGGLVRGFTEGVDQSSRVFSSVQVVTDETVNAGEAVTQSSQAIVNAAQSAAQVVRDIAEIATQTAGLSQRTRAQSEEMNLLSNQLLQSIEFFQLPTLRGEKTVIQTPVDLSQVKVPTVDVTANNTSANNISANNTSDRVETHLQSAQPIPERSL
jgi:methyl-accepting chemotaxis protein PixJ